MIKAEKDDPTDLIAHLAKAQALDLDNQHTAAIDTLTTLTRHPVVESDPIYRLLVTDQIHLSQLAQAQQSDEARRDEAVNDSYQVYEQLLTNPDLGEYAGWMKKYVYDRWTADLAGDQDVGKMAPVVVRAVGENLLIEGQNLAIEAQNHEKQGQGQLAKDLRTRAFPKLDESIRLNTLLTNQPRISPATRADAMYNLGWAIYFRARDEEIDTAMEIEAAKIWTDLAQQLPSQPNAEQAITTAVAVLRADIFEWLIGGVEREDVDVFSFIVTVIVLRFEVAVLVFESQADVGLLKILGHRQRGVAGDFLAFSRLVDIVVTENRECPDIFRDDGL